MKNKIKSYTKHPGSFLLLLLVLVAAVLTVGVLVFLVGYILIRGIPYLKPSLFAWTYNSDNVSMLPAMINTLFMTVLALCYPYRLVWAQRSTSWNTQKRETS